MKNNKTTIILIIAIVLFTTSIVPKVFQNDTFFAIGDLILDNGIDMMEHFTWHENMTYYCSHWLFDIIIANAHVAVWPMCFVMYLTYIAEYIISQMSFRKKLY